MLRHGFAPPPFATHRGFSLVELLIVLSLLALVAGLSLPSMQSWIERSRTARMCDQLVSDLQQAQTSAQQLNQALQLTRISGCPWGQPASTDWSCGWRLVRQDDGQVLHHTTLHTPLLVQAAKASPLAVSAQGDLGQVGDRWVIQSHNRSFASACTVCLNGAGRIRTVTGETCQ